MADRVSEPELALDMAHLPVELPGVEADQHLDLADVRHGFSLLLRLLPWCGAGIGVCQRATLWHMPKRQVAPRVNVSVRLSQDGIDAVQALADIEQRTWSDMLRVVLAEGIKARQRKVRT